LPSANAPYRAIVAFSGEHDYGGVKVTEASLNGFPSMRRGTMVMSPTPAVGSRTRRASKQPSRPWRFAEVVYKMAAILTRLLVKGAGA